MSNPYSSPIENQNFRHRDPLASVRGPAIALIVVSTIALIIGVLGLIADVALIVTGAVDKLEAMNGGPMSAYTKITIRIIWGILLLIASSYVLYGAIKMAKCKDYQTAKNAAIVAMIPLLGPCCLLGIPFGVWAFVVLGKPGVRESFSS